MNGRTEQQKDSRSTVKSWLGSAAITILAIIAPQIIQATSALARALTVEQAVAMAMVSNPDLLAAKQELESARAREIKAHYLNQFNPQVQGGASQAHFQFAPVGNEAQPTGSVSLEVEVAGQRSKRIEEANQNLLRVRAEVADAERLLRARTEYGFYQALYLRQRFELMERIENLNRRLRDASIVRFQSGESPKLEANLGAVRYDQSRKATLLARRDYQNGLRALQRVLGRPPEGTIELSGSLSDKGIALDAERVLRLAMANRPDLGARSFEIRRVTADIALTRRLIVPNPIITGFAEQTADAPNHFIRAFGGTVGISIPLFDHKQAELTQLRAEANRAAYQRSATQLDVEQQVRDALATYAAARETLELFQSDAICRINDSFGLIEGSYRSGKTNLLQLIVAENDLVAANSSYLDSSWDYWVARIEIEAAAGTDFETLAKP